MTDLPLDPIRLMREHPEQMRIQGGLLTKQGPQDYVGSVPAITGTLFFKDAHLSEVREAICVCFDEYEAIAGHYLTWLWREEPPEGVSSLRRTRMAGQDAEFGTECHALLDALALR